MRIAGTPSGSCASRVRDYHAVVAAQYGDASLVEAIAQTTLPHRGRARTRLPGGPGGGRDRLRLDDRPLDRLRLRRGAGGELADPAGRRPPATVFAASDAQALGVLEAARRIRRLAVPDRLSVISFDDTLLAALASPQLSPVRQPLEEPGREATRVLMELTLGKRPASTRIDLATEHVLRTSTSSVRRSTDTL